MSLLATIAAGGAIGAAARYGAGQEWPVAGGAPLRFVTDRAVHAWPTSSAATWADC